MEGQGGTISSFALSPGIQNLSPGCRWPPWHPSQTSAVPYPKFSLFIGLCDGLETQCGYVRKLLMTWSSDVWRHYQRSATRGNWVILLMKVAVIATENSSCTNFMCCDRKFKSSNWIYYQNRWTFILIKSLYFSCFNLSNQWFNGIFHDI